MIYKKLLKSYYQIELSDEMKKVDDGESCSISEFEIYFILSW